MKLIFVDCEASGPCPGLGVLTEFGAVEFESRQVFHGVLYEAMPNPVNPTGSIVTGKRFDHHLVWSNFDVWLAQWDKVKMVSDNPAFDYQWINQGMWTYLGHNPFGHTARRIGDYYAGLVGNFFASRKWKELRITPHDHNPVNDAMGNVEAFERLQKGER